MIKTAEAVSLGHPDKTSDFISSYILDRMIEQDIKVKYAVEVMIKDNVVVLGGEIKGNVNLSGLNQYVLDALADIGYTIPYAKIWGDYAINPTKIRIINLIGQQSNDINIGVEQDGWGDQGVFVGYACHEQQQINKELLLAKKLNNALYNKAKHSNNLGIDIKTQITLDDLGDIDTAIVAIPMLQYEDLTDFTIQILKAKPNNIIINGTGIYRAHSTIADCGVTGRKLACDFYSTACPIGGGSPWGKDASKSDVTLNIYARHLAKQYLEDNDECFVYLSSCIGRAELPSAMVKIIKNKAINIISLQIHQKPSELIKRLGLNTPIFSNLCRNGLLYEAY